MGGEAGEPGPAPRRETRRISVPRSAVYALAGDPEGAREAWFVLHGYGQRAEAFLAEFEGLARPSRVVVAPEGLSRYYVSEGEGRVGASWMTSARRGEEIQDYVRYLDAVQGEVLGHGTGARVTVLGFSQGGATAFRWATLGRSRVDRLVSWAGGVPPDLEGVRTRERLRDVPIDLVLGTRDRFFDDARLARHEERLRELGLTFSVRRFEGGHRLDRETLARLAD